MYKNVYVCPINIQSAYIFSAQFLCEDLSKIDLIYYAYIHKWKPKVVHIFGIVKNH